ncbi:hypothetical protein SG34_032190 [Thalassomonas viridans]|uniref:Uncharacterized protein n=1 Tax=Thalassomonas viridans TaxID=137584 RepID=A0AAE9Z8Q4_9GAMM|nr:hypothetical protein [Thalassomonas viridans]WDE08583.1 hypothetical protein SG34_032190 [Thalassomonas viridans]
MFGHVDKSIYYSNITRAAKGVHNLSPHALDKENGKYVDEEMAELEKLTYMPEMQTPLNRWLILMKQ